MPGPSNGPPRPKKRRQKDTTEAPRKRGNRGDFQGRRLQHLDQAFSDYMAASSISSTKVTEWFNNDFFPGWFEKFPWYIPLTEEVPVDIDVEKGEAELSAEVNDMKEDAKKAICSKLKTWLNYQRTARKEKAATNAWQPWLNQLRDASSVRPRRLNDWQYFIKFEVFFEEVEAAFSAKWPPDSFPNEERLNKVREVAEELLKSKGDEVKQRIHQEADAQHNEAMAKWNKGSWTEDVTDPEERAAAINALSQVVQPLLDGIRAMTGLYIGMFAVDVTSDESAALSDRIHGFYLDAGKCSDGKTFSKYDPKGFKVCSKLFARFVMAAGGVGSAPADEPLSYQDILKEILPASAFLDLANQGSSQAHPMTTPHISRILPRTPITASSARTNPSSAPTGSTSSSTQASAASQNPLEATISQIRREFHQVGKAADVSEELILELAKLPLHEKTTCLSGLLKTSAYELQRESKLAKNRVLFTQLGFDDLAFPARPQKRRADEDDEDEDEAAYQPSTPDRRRKGKAPVQVRRSSRHAQPAEARGEGEDAVVARQTGDSSVVVDEPMDVDDEPPSSTEDSTSLPPLDFEPASREGMQEHIRRDKRDADLSVQNPTHANSLRDFAQRNELMLAKQRQPRIESTITAVPPSDPTAPQNSAPRIQDSESDDPFISSGSSVTMPLDQLHICGVPVAQILDLPLDNDAVVFMPKEDDIASDELREHDADISMADPLGEVSDSTESHSNSLDAGHGDELNSPGRSGVAAAGNDFPDDGVSITSGTDILDDNCFATEREQPERERMHYIGDEEPDELELVKDDDEINTHGNPLPLDANSVSLDELRAHIIGSYRCPPNGQPSIHPSGPQHLTSSEKASLRHYLAWKRSNSTTLAYKEFAASLEATTASSSVKIMGLKAVRQLAQELTGIFPKKVDICANNCLAFTGAHAKLQHCPVVLKRDTPMRQAGSIARKKGDICGHPRCIPYKGPGKERNPKRYAQMLVLPIFETIRAMFSNAKTAKLLRHRDQVMMDTLKALYQGTQGRVYSDFGDSQIHMSLRAKGLFQDPRECAGAITTDGAMLTLQKQSEVRYRLENLIIMFIIPGPWPPRLIETFFYQSFVNMLQASEGIWMYDVYASERFVFKFHLVGLLGDLMASYKFNAGTGTSGVHADIYTNVAGARATAKGNRQYIVIWSTDLIRVLNPERPQYDYYDIPCRNEAFFLQMIQRLSNAKDEKQRVLIGRETGITTSVRNIAEKLNTSYKLFEWMAIVHWYIGPFMIELGVDNRYTALFSKFSLIAEVSMRPQPFTDRQLHDLTELIILFLIEYEILYIRSVKDISRGRIVTFQLLQIPRIIRAWGSYRSVSQGTCERMIGWLGHKVRTDKAPYAQLANIILDQEIAKCLLLYYPDLDVNRRQTPPPRLRVFSQLQFNLRDLQEYSELSQHLPILSYFTHTTFGQIASLKDITSRLSRWGKLQLANGNTLQSQMRESTVKNLTRSSRYFEGIVDGRSVFGEAIVFYLVRSTKQILVVCREIKKVELVMDIWLRGSFSLDLSVYDAAMISPSLIGIWQYGERVYIIRKHAAQALLTAADSAIPSETNTED
ncbi:hypothetical protein ONZ45_g7563 [Pleurotus djamor]|nr:hypothetical protein ONZ45_g7563 [Pleurotus djamor]